MKKTITFSVEQNQYDKIYKSAEDEGLTPSQYCKRVSILSTKKHESGSGYKYPTELKDSGAITAPNDVLSLCSDIACKPQEHLMVVTLDGANQVIASRVITIGLLNSTKVHPREIFADAITDRAASIIMAHNHPSGNLKPSQQDRAITRRIKESGEFLGISLLDHIIVSRNGYYSFKSDGAL